MGSAKTLSLSGVLLASLLVSAAGATSDHPIVKAKAAILVDNQTGEVLWQRNPDLRLPNASTTKIVTAMVALQSGRLNDTVVVSRAAAHAPPSKINLRPGWKLRVRDLLYALLLNSANDSAVALAEGLGGSVPRFATRMNAMARALGARNTHFVNPNGLPAKDHYSTARDLATMFARSLQNPIFEHIMSTKTTTITPVAGSRRHIALRSHNRLLGDYRIQVLGKTGYTRAAKKCFVGAGRFAGREIGVAVLGSTDLWGDLKHLLEYGFDDGGMPESATPELEVAAAGADAAAGDDDESISPPRTVSTYFLNVRSFTARRSAQRFKADLVKHGYPCSVRKIRSARRLRYQVLVGGYPSRHAAEQAAHQLEKRHRVQPTLFVTSR